MGVNSNKCDYLIKELNKPKAKMKQVHKNRLKMYFEMGKPFAHSEEIKHKAVQTTIKMAQLEDDAIETGVKTSKNKNTIAKRLIKKASYRKRSLVQQNKSANSSNARSEQASQESKPAKRKYAKNPNNPRWKMKETKASMQASKTSEDPKSLRRSPRLAKK
jgi:hypothetical protein